MKKKIRYISLIAIALLYITCSAKAQTNYFDSLRNALLIKTDSIIYQYDTWLPIAIQINHDSVEQDLQTLKKIAQSNNNSFADAIYNIHFAYYYTEKTGNYQKGLDMAMHAKSIFEKQGAKSQLVNALCRIAFFKLWNEIAQNKQAENESILNDYLLPAQKIAASTKNRKLIIETYQWIGSYYNVSKNDNQIALAYFLKAEKLGDSTINMLTNLVTIASIGIIYADACDEKNMLIYKSKYEAIEFSNNYLYALGNLYRAISKHYSNCNKNNQLALQYAQQSFEIAKKKNAPEYISLCQYRLYEVYRQIGDEKKALFYLELYKESESSIARNKFNFAYAAYDLQNKEQLILKQKINLQQKNIYIIIALASLLLLGGLSFLLFKVRKKNAEIAIKEIEKQKQLQLDIAVRETEEEERTRISGNLHDSVVQKLVVAKMNLETLQKNNSADILSHKNIVNNIYELVDESTTEIRKLSHTLMPASFEKEGLGKVVIEFAHKIMNDEIQIDVFEQGNFLSIQKNIAIIAYRIIQECVQNTLKHAAAKNISIALSIENNKLDISVEDDGKGFDTNQNYGMGLSNIKNRVQQLHGEFHLDSSENKGTIVAISIPTNT